MAEERWNQKYEGLKRYKEDNGDCYVPRPYSLDYALGVWVGKQRIHRESLTREQQAKLVEIGFDFSTAQERQDRYWNANYERLKSFKAKFGHTRVPFRSKNDNELKPWAAELGIWVKDQRGLKNKRRLARWKKDKLDAIGFTWSIISREDLTPAKKLKRNKCPNMETKWLESYQKLCAFKDKHSHCLVPTMSYGEDPRLGHWVATQRKVWLKGKIRDDRKQLLDDIGFVWEAKNNAISRGYNWPKKNGQPKSVEHDSDSGLTSHRKRKATEQCYPVGSEFYKEFPGCGIFKGEIVSFDCLYYGVLYEDGDEEELSQSDFDNVHFIVQGDNDSVAADSDEEEDDLDRKLPAK